MTPIEAAAQAVVAEIQRQTDGAWPMDASDDAPLIDAHIDLRGIVRAVLLAIREPSAAMREEGMVVELADSWPGDWSYSEEMMAAQFRAMIDAALAEGPTGED